MKWVDVINSSIDYIEKHLTDDIKTDEVSERMSLSASYFSHVFSSLVGCGPQEYIHRRKMYLAALELCLTRESIGSVAAKFGYNTSASFIRAFTHFHKVTPQQVRDGSSYRSFLPPKILVTTNSTKDCCLGISKLSGFCMIGFKRTFDCFPSLDERFLFRKEIFKHYIENRMWKKEPDALCAKVAIENSIGEYGILMSDVEGGYQYLVAGGYDGGTVPEDMETFELERGEWAKINPQYYAESNLLKDDRDASGETIIEREKSFLNENVIVECYDTVFRSPEIGDCLKYILMKIKR